LATIMSRPDKLLYIKLILVIFCFNLLPCCVSNIEEKSYQNTADTLILGEIPQMNRLPEIGIILDKSIRMRFNSNRKLILVNSAQSYPSVSIVCSGKNFELAWNDEGKLIFISTTDSSFVTDDGFRMGSTLKEIKGKQKVDIIKERGWGYSVKLKSGWSTYFCVDSTCTGRELTDADKVNWIYKN
jgi:hypothetical protein